MAKETQPVVSSKEKKKEDPKKAAGQPSADLAELALIDIKPLEIVPLDPAETSGT